MSAFNFNAKTIDGKIYTTPVAMELNCSKVIPIGAEIVREFDENFCSVATKVFLISYGGKTLGSNDFSSMAEFLSYLDEVCACCPEIISCQLMVGDCEIVVGDCPLFVREKEVVT